MSKWYILFILKHNLLFNYFILNVSKWTAVWYFTLYQCTYIFLMHPQYGYSYYSMNARHITYTSIHVERIKSLIKLKQKQKRYYYFFGTEYGEKTRNQKSKQHPGRYMRHINRIPYTISGIETETKTILYVFRSVSFDGLTGNEKACMCVRATASRTPCWTQRTRIQPCMCTSTGGVPYKRSPANVRCRGICNPNVFRSRTTRTARPCTLPRRRRYYLLRLILFIFIAIFIKDAACEWTKPRRNVQYYRTTALHYLLSDNGLVNYSRITMCLRARVSYMSADHC